MKIFSLFSYENNFILKSYTQIFEMIKYIFFISKIDYFLKKIYKNDYIHNLWIIPSLLIKYSFIKLVLFKKWNLNSKGKG